MEYVILLLIIVGLSWIIYRNPLRLEFSTKELLLAWGVKLSLGLLFIFIFSYYYSNGRLSGDSGNFIRDGKILAEFAKNDILGYIKLLFGFNADDTHLLQTHLSETNIWSYGDNGDFINDNRLIIRINSVIHLFSNGLIWIHVILFAFVSYIGTLLIYKSFEKFVQAKKLFFWSLFLFPTLGFWGGGISKETLLIFGVGLFFYSLFKIQKIKFSPTVIATLTISLFILLFNKPYVGLILVPLSIIVISSSWIKWRKLTPFLWTGIIVLGAIVISYTPENVNLISKISYKQRDLINLGKGGIFFINDSSFCAFNYEKLDHFEYYQEDRQIEVIKNSKGEYKLFGQDDFYPFDIEASRIRYDVYHILKPSNSFIEVTPIEYSGYQMIKNIPASLFNVFVRPLPTDNGSNFKIILFIENLLLFALIIYGFKKRKQLNEIEKYWILYLIVAAIMISLIIGWTTPILGAIARYKIAPYLFFIVATFVAYKPTQIIKK
jgi:hypothetical protein